MAKDGRANAQATAAYAETIEGAAGHFRQAGDLTVSSIGIGTYIGSADDAADRGFVEAVTRAVELGCNVVDTAVNYRFQRSERNIGKALEILAERGIPREAVVICTKGGFVPFEGSPPTSPQEVHLYLQSRFVDRGIARLNDFLQFTHCLLPSYIEDQLETSLGNLGVRGVDVYYLHNPELQLPIIGPDGFDDRLRENFELLERKAREGKVGAYGLATWEGFRVEDDSFGWLDLVEIEKIAREVAGPDHRFRWIQLPYNLGMSEAFRIRNQAPDNTRTILQVAADLGIQVVASASLMQSRLLGNLPDAVPQAFPEPETDAARALQFVRSTPGITTALVGMGNPRHVESNLKIREVPPADPARIDALLTEV